ncbi:Gfo/Idh/MocA family oxidoreductase [uncultured Victivallis sp.]|uniref:Gfo/Idh/MocA family protein n=1 Tax=uncultured Victivallis sp. TaxID=354118 RepID=UPI0025CFDFAC|nr:Gfo/Idh/MocA family oxidoreductase [uncultured Victivallis sp.]
MKKLRVIQVGTAPMVHSAHAAIALRGLPETFQLEGIVEENPEFRCRAAENSAFAGLPFLTWEEALRRRPDAFVIETDEHQLVANAIRSLEAGFPTYMDKPGSEDQTQFRKMCRLAAEKKLVLTLGYMFRHNPAVLHALELKKAGKLGEIFSVEAQMSGCNDAGYHRTLPRFRGGMMYYLGCHMIDMIVHFCGFPEEVIPLNARTLSRGVDCVDFGFCAYRYAHGVSFVKTCASEVNGVNRRSIVINGTNGTFEIRPIEVPRGDGYDDTFARVTLENSHPFSDGSTALTFPPHRRYDGLFLNFARYVRKEAENPYTPEYEEKLHDLILRSCRPRA